MKRISRIILALGGVLACLSTAYSAIPNNKHPTTFLGPTARLGYTSSFNNYTAYSGAVELGGKNFRIGGTLGMFLNESTRVKVTGEYLWQKITYAFFSGDDHVWVRQLAGGLTFQHDVDFMLRPQLELGGYVSHAPSKHDHVVNGTFVNNAGLVIPFSDSRRVAGSNAIGLNHGINVRPWQGSTIGVAANYDNVKYDQKYHPYQNVKGFGGTVRVSQQLTQDLSVDLSAANRRPFNNYAGNISWANLNYYGNWTLGLNGEYTDGKATLPDTWNVGFSADYFLDQRVETISNLKGDMKGEMTRPMSDNLLTWTADPAVHMPQVLAIVDDGDPASCSGPPVFQGTIPPGTTAAGTQPVIVDSPLFFTGNNLRFSVNPSHQPIGGNTLTIDPVSGILIATGAGTDLIFATVTATNACGSATSNVFAILY